MGSEPADTGHQAVLPRLQEVLGRRVRALRLQSGKRQEEVAEAARAAGLNWIRATVAAIESGQRDLSLEEVLLLSHIFGQGLGLAQVERLGDFLEGAEGMAMLTPKALVRLEVLREYAGDADRGVAVGSVEDALGSLGIAEWFTAAMGSVERVRQSLATVWPDITIGDLLEMADATRLEAEQKAARRLGVGVTVLTVAAHQLWGQSLTAERDRRVAKQGEAAPRTAQARRAHMTRALLAEIQSAYPDLKELDRRVAEPEQAEGEAADQDDAEKTGTGVLEGLEEELRQTRERNEELADHYARLIKTLRANGILVPAPPAAEGERGQSRRRRSPG
jgi:transcriptional regulator with XRE-family HTH domain